MNSLFRMDWPYWTLGPDGILRDDDGCALVGEDGRTPTTFATREEAEQYLVDNDERGNVR